MVIKSADGEWQLINGKNERVRAEGKAAREADRVHDKNIQRTPALETVRRMAAAAQVNPQTATEPPPLSPQPSAAENSSTAQERGGTPKPPDAVKLRPEVIQSGAAESRPAETRGDDLRDRHRRFAELTRGPTATATTTSSAAATARPVTAIPPSPEVHVGPRPSEPLLREPSRSRGTDPKPAEMAPPEEAHAELREIVPAPFKGLESPAAREETRADKKAGEKKGESSSGEARRSAGTSGAGSTRGGNLDQLDAGVSADAGGGDQSGVGEEAKLIPLNAAGEGDLRASTLKATYISFATFERLAPHHRARVAMISREAAELDRGIVGLYDRIVGDDEELRKALFSAFLNRESIYG